MSDPIIGSPAPILPPQPLAPVTPPTPSQPVSPSPQLAPSPALPPQDQDQTRKNLQQGAPSSQPVQINQVALKDSLQKSLQQFQSHPQQLQQALALSKSGQVLVQAIQKPQLAVISDSHLQTYSSRYQELLGELRTQAPRGSKLHQYFTALKLLNLLQQAQQGKGPLVQDRSAHDILKLREGALKQELENLARDPEVTQAFTKVREESLKVAFGPNPAQKAQALAAHLTSSAFLAELKQLSPEKQQETIRNEMLKLSTLDPKLAQESLTKLTQNLLQDKFLNELAQEGEVGKKAEAQLTELLMQSGEDIFGAGLKGSKNAKAIAQKLVQAIKAWKIDSLKSNQAEPAISVYQALTRHLQDIPENLRKESETVIKGLTAKGGMESALAVLGLGAGLYGLATAKNAQEGFAAASATVDGLSNLHHVAHLLSVGKDTKLMNVLNNAQILGPVGDTLGAISDFLGASHEFNRGDTIGGATKFVSGLAGTAAAIANLALLAGATGPGAPITLVAATAAGLATWAVDSLYGESDQAGDIRDDLKYLGLQSKEDRNAQVIKSLEGRVWSSQAEFDQMRTKVKDMPVVQKAQVLAHLIDKVYVSAARETLIAQIFEDCSDSDFLALLQQTDTSKLASQLENEQQVLALTKRMVVLSKQGGQPLQDKLRDFLTRLGSETSIAGQAKRAQTVAYLLQDSKLEQLAGPELFAKIKDWALPLLSQVRQHEGYLSTNADDFQKMRAEVKSASPEKKAEVIQFQLNRTKVSAARETFILNLLKDCSPRDLLKTVKLLDMSLLAKHLENDQEAGELATLLARAYHQAGQSPGEELRGFLRQLSLDKRTKALTHFFNSAGIKDQKQISGVDFKALKDLTTLGSTQVNQHEGHLYTDQSDFDKMRAAIQKMPTLEQKAEAIGNILNRWVVDSQRETALYNILMDVPLQQLPDLLKLLDTRKIGANLENDEQAAALALQMARAYQQSGSSTLGKLEDYLRALGQHQRKGALDKIFAQIGQILPADQVSRLKTAAAVVQKKIANLEGYLWSSEKDFDKIRAFCKDLPPDQRAEAINKLLNVTKVWASRETLVKNILLDAPKADLPQVLKQLDTGLLISHLENNQEAADVIKAAVAAYQAQGLPPDSALTNILQKMVETERYQVLSDVISAHKSLISSLPQNIFENLVLKNTGKSGGQELLMTLLYASSWNQFNSLMENFSDSELKALAGRLKPNDLAKMLAWTARSDVSSRARERLAGLMTHVLKNASARTSAEMAQQVLEQLDKGEQIRGLPREMAQSLQQALKNYLGGYWVVSSPPEAMKKQQERLENNSPHL